MSDTLDALKLLFMGAPAVERDSFLQGGLTPYARQRLLSHYFASNASDTDLQRPSTLEEAVKQGKIDPGQIAALLGIKPPVVGS